jgi:hypothetical protein
VHRDGPQAHPLHGAATALLQVLAVRFAADSALVRLPVLVAGAVLVALFLLGNIRVVGIPLVALGLFLNALVVVANLAMPVSVAAAQRAGIKATELHLADDPVHERLTDSTRLPGLADIIPFPLPVRPQVVSPGDLVVAAGVGLLVVTGGRPAPGSRRARRQRRTSSTTQDRVERPIVLASESTTRGSYS